MERGCSEHIGEYTPLFTTKNSLTYDSVNDVFTVADTSLDSHGSPKLSY